MSKPVCYYPSRDGEICGYENRMQFSRTLVPLLNEHSLGFSAKIITAFLIAPLSDSELYNLQQQHGSAAVAEALNQELLYAATMTSKMAALYMQRYAQYVGATCTLADIGKKATDIKTLYIGKDALAQLSVCQAAFPQVKHLILEGDLLPDTPLDTSSLETLDCSAVSLREKTSLECLQTWPAGAVRSFIGFDEGFSPDKPSPYATFIQKMLHNHTQQLAIETPLKENMLNAIAASHTCLGLSTRHDKDANPYFQEWEQEWERRWRFDVQAELGVLPTSPFPPLSSVRDLVLETYLPWFPKNVHMTVADYLTDSLYVSEFRSRFHKLAFLTPEQGLDVLFRHLRQTTFFNPTHLKECYQQITKQEISTAELLDQCDHSSITWAWVRGEHAFEDLSYIFARCINLKLVTGPETVERRIQDLFPLSGLKEITYASRSD